MADTAPQKNLGLEALRMLSMFMICVLHVLGQGGILESAEPGSAQYMLGWLLEAFAVCSVNCYALISGYVGAEAGFKWSRLLRLWLEVLFYELLISLYFQIQIPDMMSPKRWLAAVTPVLSGEYWYVSAYAGMFIFIPVMNAALNTASKRRMGQAALACFLLFIVLGTFAGNDAFGIGKGYCMLWLCILYLAGGGLRKAAVLPRGGKWWLPLIYIGATTLSWLLYVRGEGRFIEYTSPTTTVAALALTLFFANTEIKGRFSRRLISAMAPATLGVYLIHANPLIFEGFIKGFAAGFAEKSPGLMAVYALAAALIIFLTCTAVDMARVKLFSLLRIDRLAGRIDKLLPDK